MPLVLLLLLLLLLLELLLLELLVLLLLSIQEPSGLVAGVWDPNDEVLAR